MSLKCIVADDEPLAMMLIEKYVRQTPGLQLEGAFTSAIEAHAALSRGDINLAFLDIQMPGLSGLQIARDIQDSGTRVVFTTAYPDHALDGFRVNALDYLLKPVSYEDFLGAAKRALSQLPVETPDHIMVKSDYRNIKVMFHDIVFIESLRDYIKINLHSEDRPLITQMSMKAILEQLPADGFARIHRSYIVALSAVKSFNKSVVVVDLNGTSVRLPVGDSFRNEFIKKANDDQTL